MRVLPRYIFLLAACAAIPAICQSSPKSDLASAAGTVTPGSTTTAQPAKTVEPVVNSGVLRDDIDKQSRVIQTQIETQRNILKKNQELMKEAKKLDEKNKKVAAKNKKLEEKAKAFNAEKQRVEAQNAALSKKNEDLKAAEKPIQTAPVQTAVK
jgi:Skp family chaperone for outer membrane proteins